MSGYKHIETCTGAWLAGHYCCAVEVGIGSNTTAAEILAHEGKLARCTDIRKRETGALPFVIDDVFTPDLTLYRNADVIYAIRPAIEMIPPLITLARATGCDLIVYHLGFESYGNGGDVIDCGVVLHRYHTGSKSIEQR